MVSLSSTPSRLTWNGILGGLTKYYMVALVGLVYLLAGQAQWGVAQFVWQGDLGLQVLGESRLSVGMDGVAKFMFGEQKLIRSYGIFEHANVFGGLMAVGLLSASFLQRKFAGNSVALFVLMSVLGLGVLLSFSRSAYVAAGLALLVGLARDYSARRRIWLVMLVLIITFSPMLLTRFSDVEDMAVPERLSGYSWAAGVLAEQSIWHGDGERYGVTLQRYLDGRGIGYQSWQIDYVHSVPLLMAVQLGLLPAIAIGVAAVWGVVQFIRPLGTVWLLPILPLLLLDHYLVTQPIALAVTVTAYYLMPRLAT